MVGQKKCPMIRRRSLRVAALKMAYIRYRSRAILYIVHIVAFIRQPGTARAYDKIPSGKSSAGTTTIINSTLQVKSIYVALPTASSISTEFAAMCMPMSIIPSPIAITIVGGTMSTVSRASACTFRLRTASQSQSH